MSLTFQAFRQVHGHLSALRVLLSDEHDAQRNLVALEQAIAIVKAESGIEYERNPAFFTGRYLNREGRGTIDALFAAGVSPIEAARRMVISPAAGHANFKRWRREQKL